MLTNEQANRVFDAAVVAAEKAMAAVADAAETVPGLEQHVALTALALMHSKALALQSLHPSYPGVFAMIVDTTRNREMHELLNAVRKDRGL